jgi:hypothetical protein
MKTKKYMGIWMDHANANLIELTAAPLTSNKIISEFTHQQKEDTLTKSENVMHNKEQHQQAAYYKNISHAFRDFDGVVLFGPTNAKAELFNLVKADHHFDKVNIEMKETDKMTDTEQHAFVKKYFHNHI